MKRDKQSKENYPNIVWVVLPEFKGVPNVPPWFKAATTRSANSVKYVPETKVAELRKQVRKLQAELDIYLAIAAFDVGGGQL